jgi:penicillin-binding protein 1C
MRLARTGSAVHHRRVRRAWRRVGWWALCALLAVTCALAALPVLAGWLSGDRALAMVEGGCEPLRVVDRAGRLLRELPAACGHRGRGAWVQLRDVPQLLRDAVVIAEDKRFYQHAGVDPRAVLRAARDDLRAGAIVSGASTITMQLARMLRSDGSPHTRSLRAKLEQAWLALALERRLGKDALLEAYLNLAYYGRGAYGAGEAAERYFAKPLSALTDGEAALLAVLPRAPQTYDPERAPGVVLKRRAVVLALLARAGLLDADRRAAIEQDALRVQPRPPAPPEHAGHFVDWALAQLPAGRRRAGGELRTTLDLDLQLKLERATSEHVASVRASGIDQAGLVVLDAQSGEIRALVGSTDYARAQLDITTRRRQLGSVLKPFVYALAIEQGQSPASLALDVGDADSAYRARDWVGREGGPLDYRSALAGSYNLAALHVLERVGVAALHARLRAAGVAELSSAPQSYGLQLALGNARVRLLDLAAGYGFLVRAGRVREPSGVSALMRRGTCVWRASPARDRALFSPEVSWLTMDILSDPAARHQRFGLDLPIERLGRVVAKTGTASGLSDLTAVLASREWIVAAWAGRFDGKPTRSSGLWGAGPLAVRALQTALAGAAPTLPERPAGVVLPEASALGDAPLPRELEAWAERGRVLGNRARGGDRR